MFFPENVTSSKIIFPLHWRAQESGIEQEVERVKSET
jgi:hypothetical protein